MGVWGVALQGVLGADANIQAGIAEGKQAEANKKLADDAAADALQRGAKEAGAVRMAGSELAAAQALAFTNSGVDASVGTAASVQSGTRARANLDALTAANNAAREAWGYKKHGLAFEAQAGINASRRNRELAGTVLGSIGSGVSEYSKKGWGV